MLDLLVYTAVALLIFVGILHFYWAMGGKFLADAVIPKADGEDLFTPTPFLTGFVGVVLFSFAFVLYSLQFIKCGCPMVFYSGIVIALLFFVRSIGDFKVVGFSKKEKIGKFAYYDTRVFSPFCLFISLVFVLVLLIS